MSATSPPFVPAEEPKAACWIHATTRHDILECNVFSDMTPKDRMWIATDYRACWCCLKTGHRLSQCYRLRDCGKEGCQRKHHPMLHEEEKNIKIIKHVAGEKKSNLGKNQCLLQIMKLQAGTTHVLDINVMWDSGATVSMITFRKARELGLSGTKTNITIVKIGGQSESVESKIYNVPLRDVDGNIEFFQAYGISQISSPIETIKVDQLAEYFEVEPKKVARPEGEIDMLVGFEYAGFHPERNQSRGHLVLMKSKFGQCLSGSHNTVEEKTKMLIKSVQISHAAVTIEDFYTNESLGVACQPKCGNCKCGECPMGGKQYNLQEERELAVIDKGLELCDSTWTARYPWKRDPAELPNNYTAAFAMLRSTERRLQKDPQHAQMYADQIQDMVNRKVAKKLKNSEIRDYNGPTYYISHHDVMKPDSESTPCRIVFNSSAKFANHILNDYWMKGPDLMNNLLAVLIRFRENIVAIAGDIHKMYHTVKISELDQHTHRFLWRDMETSRKPDTYTMTSVSFGDKPAGAIASLALQKTAKSGEEKYPLATRTIIKNSYVDDILGSFDNHDQAELVTHEIDRILENGGFKMKGWVKSAEKNTSPREVGACGADQEAQKSSRVLGIVWNPVEDKLEFKIKLNFSPKQRKVRTDPDLTESDVPEKIPTELTKRMILSQVNGIFDPLGMATPFIVVAKILLRNLNINELGWDDPVPEHDRLHWVKFFTEMFQMQDISFHRSIKPQNAIGNPLLVIFSDASENAFGTCAYARWKINDGKFESRLIAAKSRLAPAKKLTMPRLELNAALLGARLQQFVIKESNLEFSKIYLIVDSEIVRAMIQKASYGFNTFTGVRVGEIQALTKGDDWYWVESSKNIADIVSRGAHPSQLGMDSEWQCGPQFLQDDEEKWPLEQSFSGSTLPDQVVMLTRVSDLTISNIINIDRFSSYKKLIRVTARVQSACKKMPTRSLKRLVQIPNRDAQQEAERLWILDSQASIAEHIKPETLKRLGVTEVDRIKVVGARLEDWKRNTYNNQNPVLLSSKSKFAVLYAKHKHNECHLGVSAVAVKVRSKFWIVGLRNLLKSIRTRCVTCRKMDIQIQQQIMGRVPSERLHPAPAWSYTSIDIFGPYEIKGEVNKRTHGKGYGVIFNCLLSRAVHLDLATDYSTDSFLLVLRRFISLRGCPVTMWSDRGSQLKAADKDLREIVAGLDEEAIVSFGAENSFDWKFCSPDAPWQNGCAEALIKSVKKALKIAIGSQVFSFSEMQTVLTETANLVNERPIGRHPTSVEDGSYLSPNDLLLGRSDNRVPNATFDVTTSHRKRYAFVQRVVSSFWKRWTEDFFPSLIVQQKWHTARRNVKVGDVVIVQDANRIRGKWKLGRVTSADPSLRDGFVRNVELQYKNPGSRSFTTITRPIQRLVVLVPIDEKYE